MAVASQELHREGISAKIVRGSQPQFDPMTIARVLTQPESVKSIELASKYFSEIMICRHPDLCSESMVFNCEHFLLGFLHPHL